MSEHISPTIETVDFPSSHFEIKNGFSLDFGASVLKVAYAKEIKGKIWVHFMCFPKDRVLEALQHIKTSMKDRLIPGQDVYVTGVEGKEYQQDIFSMLGGRINIIMEKECCVKGFIFLMKNLPRGMVLHPKDREVEEYARRVHRAWSSGWAKSSSLNGLQPLSSWNNEPKMEALTDRQLHFPILLASCESAAGMMKILSEDGKFELLDTCPISGKTLLASGACLAEAKTFDELVSLAAKGSADNLDILAKHVLKNRKILENDRYSELSCEMRVYTLGHMVGKDRDYFTREDRADAAISLVMEVLAMWAHQWAHRCNTSHVYFCGGIYRNSSLIRDRLARFFSYRGLADPLGDRWIEHHFVKLGAYLGVFGGLLRNLRPL